jgi:osmotically-inducible protein OsmY
MMKVLINQLNKSDLQVWRYTMITDKELGEFIAKAIMRDERLSFQPIELSVENGIVTLTGSVQTYRRKLAAQELVSSFEGCRDVVNQLVVKCPHIMSDQEIANNVRSALDSHADITKETIVVSVERGIVSLSGSVGSQWERIVAEDVARSAKGVNDINNYLAINLPSKMEDKGLEQDIKEALTYARGLKNHGISVAVSGSVVVLSGNVSRLSQKEMAERVARQFRLWEIRNLITVTGS